MKQKLIMDHRTLPSSVSSRTSSGHGSPAVTKNSVTNATSNIPKCSGYRSPKTETEWTAPMLTNSRSMKKTLSTGTKAIASALTIVLKISIFPRIRSTRPACRLVFSPTDCPGMRASSKDDMMTSASKRFQGLLTKGTYQFANALIASSAKKKSTKAMLRRSQSDESDSEPEWDSWLMSCVCRIVTPKFKEITAITNACTGVELNHSLSRLWAR
mmetsp:Transcript_52864/g.139158  ORF Transcript_52864/g.139158 Transcript_52864/m.139158 type:complete len:214 (-) Transcript_52864:676-1317(-)